MHEFERIDPAEALKPKVTPSVQSLPEFTRLAFAQWRTAPAIERTVSQENWAAWRSYPAVVQASLGVLAVVAIALPLFVNTLVPIGFVVFLVGTYADLYFGSKFKPRPQTLEDQFGELEPESHFVNLGVLKNGKPYAGDYGVFRLSEGVFHFQGIATEFSFDAGCVIPNLQITPSLGIEKFGKSFDHVALDFPQVSLQVGEDVLTVFLGPHRADTGQKGLEQVKALKPVVNNWAKNCTVRVANNVYPPLQPHKVEVSNLGRQILLKVKILAAISLLSGISQYAHVLLNPVTPDVDQHFRLSMAAASVLMGVAMFAGMAIGTAIGNRRVKKILQVRG